MYKIYILQRKGVVFLSEHWLFIFFSTYLLKNEPGLDIDKWHLEKCTE